MVWNHIYQSADVNIGIGTFKRHLKSHLLSIISWTIIVSTVCAFPLYVFRIHWSTRHDLITGAPYALFLHPYTCTLNWICVSVMGAYKHYCLSPICHSVLCCICIVYCKAYCGNKLLFCSVLFCSNVLSCFFYHILVSPCEGIKTSCIPQTNLPGTTPIIVCAKQLMLGGKGILTRVKLHYNTPICIIIKIYFYSVGEIIDGMNQDLSV